MEAYTSRRRRYPLSSSILWRRGLCIERYGSNSSLWWSLRLFSAMPIWLLVMASLPDVVSPVIRFMDRNSTNRWMAVCTIKTMPLPCLRNIITLSSLSWKKLCHCGFTFTTWTLRFRWLFLLSIIQSAIGWINLWVRVANPNPLNKFLIYKCSGKARLATTRLKAAGYLILLVFSLVVTFPTNNNPIGERVKGWTATVIIISKRQGVMDFAVPWRWHGKFEFLRPDDACYYWYPGATTSSACPEIILIRPVSTYRSIFYRSSTSQIPNIKCCALRVGDGVTRI